LAQGYGDADYATIPRARSEIYNLQLTPRGGSKDRK